MKRYAIPFLLLLLLAAAPIAFAADANPDKNVEARLREALRDATVKLQSAQADNTALQAAATEKDGQIKALTDKLDAATKQLAAQAQQAAAEKAAAAEAVEKLNAALADKEARLAAFADAVQKWKAAYTQAANLALQKEAERAKAAADLILANRRADDNQAKNLELYKLGDEILTRYEKFSLGDAITAKEPFVGLTRVHLQNLVQDYKEKLEDQRIVTAR